VIGVLYALCMVASLVSLAVILRPRPVPALRPTVGTRPLAVHLVIDGRTYVGELRYDTAA